MFKFLLQKLHILLFIVVITSFVYSFALSLKRYNNYEYGKFDLGNMSQMVWNSSHGSFMELTDQFGTNMPRWGMSHVDPVLLLFVPIYWVYAHPMVLVFIQQIVVLSAAFAIYYLVLLKTKSPLLSFIAGVVYTFYPAIGYTLIWTTFHGISFVAPLLIWLVYFLEKNNFLVEKVTSNKNKYIYWILIVLMLTGKEQIGFMIAIACIFLYPKNKSLAIKTAIVSFIWFIIAFFIVIPAYAPLRQTSVDNFINEVGIKDATPEVIQGENFFLVRYSHLGNSYGEMLKNSILKPQLLFEEIDDDIKVFNDLFGPLGYVVILNPFWLMSVPDIAISVLSSEQIFGIDNHRIAFVISGLFISYVYILFWINRKYKLKFALMFASLTFISTIYFSYKSQNPLIISATSFINEKIVSKVFAENINTNDFDYYGKIKKGSVPRNNKMCLDNVVKIVYEKNPQIYSGPDYLGAHTSNRKVNALFPGRISDAELIVADLFDEKAIDRVGVDAWFVNKLAMEKIYLNGYKNLYSCGMVNIFEKANVENANIDTFEVYNGVVNDFFTLNTGRVEFSIASLFIPKEVKLNEPSSYKIAISKPKGGFNDTVSYWKFVNKDNSDYTYSFIDYLTASHTEIINKTSKDGALEGRFIEENINITIPDYVKSGQYKVYYGVGDLVKAFEVYLSEIEIHE
jgi:uncharacterized membrane protein